MLVIREAGWNEAEPILYQAEDPSLRKAPGAGHGRLRWFIASMEGRPVGVAALWTHKRAAELKRCFVLPQWRGQGIGEALIRHRVSEAQREGCAVARVNALNPAWFERNGWRLTRRTTRFWYLTRFLWD